jgi:signal transduction histidine kinase
VEPTIGLAEIAHLGGQTLESSAEAIEAVTELVARITTVDITVVSEVTADGTYHFRGVENRSDASVERDSAIPYAWSLCSRVHAGESPASVSDTRTIPALWASWLRLKEGLGVDWDILSFCTRDIVLPDGQRFGTLCLHHREPREFSPDEEALLELLGRLIGQEIARERARDELVSALAALDVAEGARVELAEELRHELRAPLQIIDGYAEGMLDGVVARDDEHVVLVRREATRAMRLLDDLAELARLEGQPRLDDQVGVVRIDTLTREMRDRLAPLAESAGVALGAVTVEASVAGSVKRVEQLVINLVRNALRATRDGAGSAIGLSVGVDAESDEVVLAIEDDGPGIPSFERERVFERFFRGHSGREAGEGSGLGLTIVERIVETMGGGIEVEPVKPTGTRIVVRLPRLSEQDVR